MWTCSMYLHHVVTVQLCFQTVFFSFKNSKIILKFEYKRRQTKIENGLSEKFEYDNVNKMYAVKLTHRKILIYFIIFTTT